MADLLFYLLVAVVVAASAVLIAVLARGFLAQPSSGNKAVFGARPEKRLAVVEQANLDGRRKLVLLRRDNTEHLIMTGGPIDVVIETGIEAAGVAANTGPSRNGTARRSAEPLGFGKPKRDAANEG